MPRDMLFSVACKSASGPPSLLSGDTMALSPEYGDRGLKLTNHVQLICRSKACRAVPQLFCTSSWCRDIFKRTSSWCRDIFKCTSHILNAMLWFRPLIASFWPRRPGFDPRPLREISVMEAMALGVFFFEYYSFPCRYHSTCAWCSFIYNRG